MTDFLRKKSFLIFTAVGLCLSLLYIYQRAGLHQDKSQALRKAGEVPNHFKPPDDYSLEQINKQLNAQKDYNLSAIAKYEKEKELHYDSIKDCKRPKLLTKHAENPCWIFIYKQTG